MIQDSEPQKLLSSNVDPVKSSAMQKKIRQKYFKNDAVIKAYKCDLMSQNINTPVKLYVCHSALNLVHRPKRRILTALLFSQIVELKVQNEHSVNIHTTSNETYTLANFERSDSAIAFLRNYWEVILKEKCFSPSYGSSPANRLFVNNNTTNNNNNTNDLLTHPNAIISDLYNRLLISKGSTTVSLTSTSGGATGSISNSETESVVGVKKQESSIRKFSLGVCKPSLIEFNHLNKETTNQNINIGSNDVIQHNDNSNVTNPIVNNVCSTPSLSNIPMKQNNTTVYQQHTKTYNNETVNTNNSNNNKFNFNRPNVTISTDWNWWPFNVLTYLFNASPSQRFTMMIAYAILGFLFLSTIHLYHRLALIDLQTGPTIRRAGIHQQSSTTSNSELHNLEAQLTYLTQLTSKMIETLGYLTSELNSFVLYSNPEKFSPDQSTLNT
ncbi:unnamed protein product [Schistosoma rodhaini]|uniref:GRAM domain-containing protein n=1 Tax=Schistosoma mansoni TaxID=6183 RepID=A0A3Q0KMD2_SCHMA|nr:unnamed protein product [Schistosoma rodhaini]